jgi:choline-phosphate cytidylyltransferase/glycerol-3-phosphate cytidylyltransferase
MKKVVWKNKYNGQLCTTIPKDSGIKEGDIIEIEKPKIKRIVYSHSGSDLFHYGHLRLLEAANKLGDLNICGVLTSNAIKSYKEEPIVDFKERMAILSSLRCVDMVIKQKTLNPTENLKKIRNQFKDSKIILVHGSDWKKIPGEDYIKKIGGEVVHIPFYEKLSTKNIVKKFFRVYGAKRSVR